MGRRRDQAQIALPLLAALMVFANRQQPGVLALGAGVGLHADGIETGDRTEPILQFVDHGLVALGLLHGCKWVQLSEPRPGDGDHLAGGIELHGAGAQRDHRLVQRQVLVFQLFEVAQHLRFAMVRTEHRMGQVRRGAQ
ncbi:hypothetical protein D3C85_888800 [compost metagenome]